MGTPVYVVSRNSAFIPLGRQGENEALTVRWPNEPWAQSADSIVLLHKRNTDKEAYPVAATVSGGVITWTVSSADTAIAGDGECELQFYSGDIVAKSRKWKTKVFPSIGEPGETPEAYQGWVDQLLDEVKEIVETGGYGGGAASLEASDDGDGNVTITTTSNSVTLVATDDGSGVVTVAMS